MNDLQQTLLRVLTTSPRNVHGIARQIGEPVERVAGELAAIEGHHGVARLYSRRRRGPGPSYWYREAA